MLRLVWCQIDLHRYQLAVFIINTHNWIANKIFYYSQHVLACSLEHMCCTCPLLLSVLLTAAQCYWLLLSVTDCCSVLLTAAQCYWLLLSVTDCCSVLLTAAQCYWLLLSVTDCCSVLLTAAQCYWLLLSVTDCCSVLLTAAQCYWLLLSVTDCCSVLLTAAQCYWLLTVLLTAHSVTDCSQCYWLLTAGAHTDGYGNECGFMHTQASVYTRRRTRGASRQPSMQQSADMHTQHTQSETHKITALAN